MKGTFLRRDYEKAAIHLAEELSPHLKDRWALTTMHIDDAMIDCMTEHGIEPPETGALRRGTYIHEIIPKLKRAIRQRKNHD